MINKSKKIINNKFSRYFKFVFFLRYLLVIFFVASISYLFIPTFFDYKKKTKIIKLNIAKNYDLEILKLDEISYNIFPLPHLQISNTSSKLKIKDINIKSQKILIYPKILSIYNYENFQIKKVDLINNKIQIDLKEIKSLIKSFLSLEKKFNLKNLNLKISDTENKVISFDEINFKNYGYYKNNISGKVFSKKFKIKLLNDLKQLNFKLIDTGVEAKLDFLKFNQEDAYKGQFIGKVLKSNLRFDFNFEKNHLKIDNFKFRDKNLAFDSKGILKLKPFFDLNMFSKINNIDLNIFKNFEVSELLKFEEFIKRINKQHILVFKSPRFSGNLIDNLEMKINLAFGRLKTEKEFLISESKFNCENKINLLDDYPIFYFNCSINSSNKSKLFSKFKIKSSSKDGPLNLVFKGNLNVLNNKINFDEIKMNKNYNASLDDLKYFKNIYENIIFDDNFINMFDLSKIRKFVKEIS